MLALTFTIPVRTVSEANRAGHEHWAKTAARRKKQRELAQRCMFVALRSGPCPPQPWRVELTRVAARQLDSDNLASSFKALQDGIADELGLDDRYIEWDYRQRRGEAREYCVEVEVKTRETI